jgi:hypothetical protein
LALRKIIGAATEAYVFSNSCIALSAKTPPVIESGANGALAAISALEIMIWSSLVESCCTDAANTTRPIAAPQNRTDAHGARFTRGIERGAPQCFPPVPGDAIADRYHLAMGRWVALGASEISPAREDSATLHDDCAERQISDSRLRYRQPHEAFILGCVHRRDCVERGAGL